MFAKTVLALSALLASSLIARSAEWPDCIEGQFAGEIQSSGVLSPSQTNFVSEGGSFSGTYWFEYESEQVKGTLSDSTKQPPRSITFQWHDKFGTGTLVTSFSDDCSEFSGRWGSDAEAPRYSWDGKRK